MFRREAGVYGVGDDVQRLVPLADARWRAHPRRQHTAKHVLSPDGEPHDVTAYADLEPCDYFDLHTNWSLSLKAIGWLGAEDDFPTGAVPSIVRAKLQELSEQRWQPCFFMGHHYCGLCVRSAGGFVQDFLASWQGTSEELPRGCANLFVPGRGYVYVAPELALHYIDKHRYLPPAEFLDAVMACPPMESPAYFKLLWSNANSGFRDAIPWRPWWHFWSRWTHSIAEP